MKKVILFLLLIVLLSSCELVYENCYPAPKVEKVRILVYGNSFKGDPSANELSGTVNDAASVGLALSGLCEKAGYDYETYYLLSDNSIENPSVVPTDNADYQTVERYLKHIKDNAYEFDMTIIYFATHGVGKDDKLNYGSDIKENSAICFNDNYSNTHKNMPISLLLEKINEIAGIKIVFGDFCYSGSIIDTSAISMGSSEYNDITFFELFTKGLKKSEASSKTFILSSSRYYEKSWEGNSHGYFTIALLSSLGWSFEESKIKNIPILDSNGALKLSSIVKYVSLNDNQKRQNPMTSATSSDIILFKF